MLSRHRLLARKIHRFNSKPKGLSRQAKENRLAVALAAAFL